MMPRCSILVLSLVVSAPALAQESQAPGGLALSIPAPPEAFHLPVSTRVPVDERWNATGAQVENSTLLGAGIGFVVGAGATWVVLNAGGSSAFCDRDANQDAMSPGECLGITIVGGAVGALVGALVTRWL
jgi:hypothetical protein